MTVQGLNLQRGRAASPCGRWRESGAARTGAAGNVTPEISRVAPVDTGTDGQVSENPKFRGR